MIKPMLACEWNNGTIKEEFLISPKIDGIRALSINNEPISRSGKVHRNKFIQEKFKELPSDIILDGELLNCVEFGQFGDNTKDIMSIDKPLGNLKYYVFDIVSDNFFMERLKKLKSLDLPDWCIVVDNESIFSNEELDNKIEDYLKQGYEGAILRNPKAKYKHGRATKTKKELFKVKNFSDCEAQIIDIVPYFKNNNESKTDELGYSKKSTHKDNLEQLDKVGSFKAKIINGKYKDSIVNVGTGLTENQRLEYYNDNLKGSIIKIKYFDVGIKDNLRFPVFLGFRDSNDM